MVEAPAVVQIPDNCRHNRSVVASVHISLLGDGRKRGKGFSGDRSDWRVLLPTYREEKRGAAGTHI